MSIRTLIILFAGLVAGPLTAAAESLTLARAEELALQNHPRVSAAQLQALASREATAQVRSAFFPTLVANATAVGVDREGNRITAGALNNPSVFDRNGDGLVLNQLITDFGRTANLTKGAEFRSRAREQDALTARARVLLVVSESYFGALEAQAVLRVAGQTVATYQLIYDQVFELARNKIKSDLDVSFARVSLEQGRILQVKAQNDVNAAFTTLADALGSREEQRFELIEEALPATNVMDGAALVQQALASRPELAALRYERDASRRQFRAERDANYPTISAIAVAGITPVRDALLNDDHYAAAGVNLSLPIFAGGLYKSRQNEADFQARRAEETLRDAENDVVRDVRVAALNANYALERMGLTAKLAQSASEAFELAQARYQTGVGSIVELSQAQLNRTAAEIDETNAKYQYQIQRAALDYQTGRLAVGAAGLTGATRR